MIHLLKNFAKRFRRDENGNATIEFVILFPMFIAVLVSSVELGMITMRHSMLERGVDMAVRDVRLGTGNMQSNQLGHDTLKTAICGYAVFLPDCENNLKLEMVSIDLRSNVSFPNSFDCVDLAEEANPVRSFSAGQANELMLLQVCALFSPLFPTSAMGSALQKDASGMAMMYAMSAFVQEPQ